MLDLNYLRVRDYEDKTLKAINEVIDFKIFPYALSNKNCDLYLSGSVVSENPDFGVKVEGRSIDELIDEDEKITFIKLDIDGTELDALKGAARTIQKHKPRLIVCLYHWPSDLWEIPFFIKKLCPEYRLYIKPHYNHKLLLEVHAICE